MNHAYRPPARFASYALALMFALTIGLLLLNEVTR